MFINIYSLYPVIYDPLISQNIPEESKETLPSFNYFNSFIGLPSFLYSVCSSAR